MYKTIKIFTREPPGKNCHSRIRSHIYSNNYIITVHKFTVKLILVTDVGDKIIILVTDIGDRKY